MHTLASGDNWPCYIGSGLTLVPIWWFGGLTASCRLS